MARMLFLVLILITGCKASNSKSTCSIGVYKGIDKFGFNSTESDFKVKAEINWEMKYE